jgi:arylsulfatase A-like enzyme
VAATNAKGQPSYNLDGADEKSFTTDFLADRTIDFIRSNKEKPFCYMVAIPDPHGPNTVRPPYDTMFDEMKFQQPPSALAKGKGLPSFSDIVQSRFNARQMALYFGMVKCIDDNIGKILDDPISATATIKSDLSWAISDSPTYTPSPRSTGKKAEKK